MGSLSDELLQDLADAATDIQASERTEGLAAVTYEDLLTRRLAELNGDITLTRPSKKERISARKTLFANLLEKLQAASKDPPYDPFFNDLCT